MGRKEKRKMLVGSVEAKSAGFRRATEKFTFTLWLIGSCWGFYQRKEVPVSIAALTKMDRECWEGGGWKTRCPSDW